MWSRYGDDTFAFIDPAEIQNDVLQTSNTLDEKIQFTYELEEDRKIAFLDVHLERNSDNILETSVYRKETNNNMYINWHSYSPKSWKVNTLRNMFKRATYICSTEEKLDQEMKHLESAFCDINDYPPKLVKYVISDELKKYREPSQADDDTTTGNRTNEDDTRTIQLNLPFAGDKGDILVKKMRKAIAFKCSNVKIRLTYTPTKLGSRFQVTDKTKFDHCGKGKNIVHHRV